MLWVLIEAILMGTNNIRFYGPGDSNEYPQHLFLWRNVENCPQIITKYPPYLF